MTGGAAGPHFVGPAIVLPLATAARVARALDRVLVDARRNGIQVSPDVARLAELCQDARRALDEHAARDSSGSAPGSASGSAVVPHPDDEPHTVVGGTPGWISTTDAAARLGISSRAVRKRCATGTLAGTQDDNGRWLVDPAALPPSKEPTCPEPRCSKPG